MCLLDWIGSTQSTFLSDFTIRIYLGGRPRIFQRFGWTTFQTWHKRAVLPVWLAAGEPPSTAFGHPSVEFRSVRQLYLRSATNNLRPSFRSTARCLLTTEACVKYVRKRSGTPFLPKWKSEVHDHTATHNVSPITGANGMQLLTLPHGSPCAYVTCGTGQRCCKRILADCIRDSVNVLPFKWMRNFSSCPHSLSVHVAVELVWKNADH